MFTISKRFDLCLSHQLDGLPEGHQCGRVHGHNVMVEVVLAAEEVDNVGMILDYGELAPLREWLDNSFDHRHLNDEVWFNPTAELMARHVYEWCSSRGWPVRRVGWSETPKTWAWYEA